MTRVTYISKITHYKFLAMSEKYLNSVVIKASLSEKEKHLILKAPLNHLLCPIYEPVDLPALTHSHII